MTIDDRHFRREVDSLMEVRHPNVVRFLGLCSHTVETPMKIPETRGYIYVEKRERLLCFEYISNGSLDKKITGTTILHASLSFSFFLLLLFN
jgi:coatomer subunit beta'